MTAKRGQGSLTKEAGVFPAPGDPSRAPRLLDLLGEDGRYMGEPPRSPIKRRFRDRLQDWGWWPEPLTEHWVLIDRERQREIDVLTDQLVVMLLTSRSVGAGIKTKVRRQHNLIKVARLFRWRRTQ